MKRFANESSQLRNWTFTPDALRAERERVNSEARTRIAALREKEGDPVADATWVSADEQCALCHYYETKIMAYCAHFKFDPVVQATALVLFKRFYVRCSVMDFDVKLVVLTCVFLATKVENSVVALDKFLQKIPKPPPASVLLDLEFVVSQKLNFEFYVWGIEWPLKGFLYRLEAHLRRSLERDAADGEPRRQLLQRALTQLQTDCLGLVQTAYLTDLPLLHWPSHIGLAIVLHSCRASPASWKSADTHSEFWASLDDKTSDSSLAQILGDISDDATRFFQELCDAGDGGLEGPRLAAAVKHIQDTLAAYQLPVAAKLGPVTKRLQTCDNPAFKPGTRSFQDRLQSEQADLLEQKKKQQAHKREIYESRARELQPDAKVFD